MPMLNRLWSIQALTNVLSRNKDIILEGIKEISIVWGLLSFLKKVLHSNVIISVSCIVHSLVHPQLTFGLWPVLVPELKQWWVCVKPWHDCINSECEEGSCTIKGWIHTRNGLQERQTTIETHGPNPSVIDMIKNSSINVQSLWVQQKEGRTGENGRKDHDNPH